MGIDPRSVEHWDDCLYGGQLFFGTNRTSDVVAESSEKLQEYARYERAMRIQNPYGDIYFQELDEIPLKGKRVLEFGCGAGIDSLYFASQGAELVACDVVPSNVIVTGKIIAPYSTKAVLLKSYEDLASLGEFDLVYSHGCLHHIPDRDVIQVVPELCSRVKPGGLMLVMVYTTTFYPHENVHPEGPFSRGYSVEQLLKLFWFGMTLERYRVFNNRCFSWALFRRGT